MASQMRQLPIIILLAVALGMALGFMIGKGSRHVTSDRLDRLIADSIITAGIIKDRDSLISEISRDVTRLEGQIARRPKVYIRVKDASNRLISVDADSLLRVLDRPLPEI